MNTKYNLTAIAIGVIMFGEMFTTLLLVGIVLILVAVLIIVLGKNLKRTKER